MEIMNIDTLKELINKKNNPSVSIYIPTFRKGTDTEQNHIRFKNQVRDAEKKLVKQGLRQVDVEAMLKPAFDLIDDADFWTHQEDGFAAFIAPGEFFYFKVPEHFQEYNYISDHYSLRPFLKLMNTNERFLILALNQKNVRLFESSRFNIEEIKLKNVMTSLDDYMATEENEVTLQLHNLGAGVTGAGGREAIFAVQGDSHDDATHKEKIKQFFYLVDTGLQKYLSNEKAPLLLAGIDYLLPIYREANSYSYIMEETLPHNTQDMTNSELRDAAWQIVKTRIEKKAEDALSQFGNYAGTKRATAKVEEIIRNLYSNRILYLFINENENVWGKFDPNSYRIEVHYKNYEAQDIDFIDLAAEQTLLHNGMVFSINAARMPNGHPMAALFRY